MRWLQVIVTLIPDLIFLSGIMVNTTHGWEKIANGVGLLAFAVLGIRIARLGLFAGPDELLVRNYFCTYRIKWHDIAAFEMPPRYGTLRKTGLRIRLQDGRVRSASLYTRGQIDSGRAAQTVLEQLQRLRNEHGLDTKPVLQSPQATAD